jgi:FkbM family methyltransferase
MRLSSDYLDSYAESFCARFFSDDVPKYVFGANEYTSSIAKFVSLTGVIDTVSERESFQGIPVVPIDLVPDNALVVSIVVLGKPLTAERKLSQYRFEHLDYFSFLKFSGVPLSPVLYQEGMRQDIEANQQKYETVFASLGDEVSRNQMQNIVNFRLTNDLRHMRGFQAIEHLQYFEDFLDFEDSGEVFLDVGGLDGFTSREFLRLNPGYEAVHIFEPEPLNRLLAEENLLGYPNVHFHEMGLSDKKESLTFNSGGAASVISDSGDSSINVDRLDAVFGDRVTFIKMDIEGWELPALRGASDTILKNHPRLAVAAYHGVDDLWRIPELILGIRDDYRVFLRHYTEGVCETILFFVPR